MKMKKAVLFLLLMLTTSITAIAQTGDFYYIDALKIFNGEAQLRSIADKGYTLLTEAEGFTHDIYYTKGDVHIADNLQWYGTGSLVIVNQKGGKVVAMDVLYSDPNSIGTTADEITYSRIDSKGVTENDDFKVFKFAKDDLDIRLYLPKDNAKRMASLHIERRGALE